jgi:hypothetical protein
MSTLEKVIVWNERRRELARQLRHTGHPASRCRLVAGILYLTQQIRAQP